MYVNMYEGVLACISKYIFTMIALEYSELFPICELFETNGTGFRACNVLLIVGGSRKSFNLIIAQPGRFLHYAYSHPPKLLPSQKKESR